MSLRSQAIELLSLQSYLSPQFQVTAATKARDDQNTQLTIDSPWPGVEEMERQVGFRCPLLA